MLSRTIVAPTPSGHKPGILSFPYFATADVICPLILQTNADGRRDDEIVCAGMCCGGFVRAVRIVCAADVATAGAEARGFGGGGQAPDANAAYGGRNIQLQRTGISGIRDVALCDRHSGEKWISCRARRCGGAHGLGGYVWERKARYRVYHGHRLHSAR